MLLILSAIFTLVLIFFLYIRRDRFFLKKDLKQILDNDMKKKLNLPTNEDRFPSDFEKKKTIETTSKKLVRALNEKTQDLI